MREISPEQSARNLAVRAQRAADGKAFLAGRQSIAPQGETPAQRWAREDAELEAATRFTDVEETTGEYPDLLNEGIFTVPSEDEGPLNEAFEAADEIPGHTGRRRFIGRVLRETYPPAKDDARRLDFRERRGGTVRASRWLHSQREASRRLGLVTTLTDEEWRLLIEAYSSHCAYCDRVGEVLHADHVEPRSRGGSFALGNIVPACRVCNFSKRAKDLVDWLEERGRSVAGVFGRMDAAVAYVRSRGATARVGI